MIPGHPPNTTYRTIALDDFGVFMCAAQEGCPKGLGWRAHWYGRVDRAGTIHWKQADKRASRRGMRHLGKLLALAFNRDWWTRPKWERLYLTNVWTTKTIRERYHYRIRSAWSRSDRILAGELVTRAGIRKTGSLRWHHRGFYLWLKGGGVVVEYPSREGVPQE